MSDEDADSVSVEDRPQADASDEAASSKSNTTPVTKGRWSWEDYKREYHGDGTFDRSKALGFNADAIPELLSTVNEVAESVSAFIDERTVTVQDDFDEANFFKRKQEPRPSPTATTSKRRCQWKKSGTFAKSSATG